MSMEGNPFEIRVDLEGAVKDFDRFANSIDRLTQKSQRYVEVSNSTNTKLQKLYQTVKDFDVGGVGWLTKSTVKLGESFQQMSILVTRATTDLRTYKTAATAVYNVERDLLEKTKSLRRVTQERIAEQRQLANEYMHTAAAVDLAADKFKKLEQAETSATSRSSGPNEIWVEEARKQSMSDEAITKRLDTLAEARAWAATLNRRYPGEEKLSIEQIMAKRRLEVLGNYALASTVHPKVGPVVVRDSTPQPSDATVADRIRAREGLSGGYYPRSSTGGGGVREPGQGNGYIVNEGDSESLAGIRIGHVARVFAIYRAFNMLRQGLLDVTDAAHKMNQAIGEIQTIAQNSTKTFSQFKSEILDVSATYGLLAEDVAEGTYQAISNQVVDAAHSFEFMNSAAKFAITTQASLADSVNLLSSALNSYGLGAEKAEVVSASLFKTIEIGRLRASDIANQFGGIAVLGNQLSIDLDELNASLAALTVNGVKSDTAMTFLRGVMQKLVKPTEEMSELLKTWGYETGQAAISAEGFASILARISKETDGSAERFGELFNYVRAMQGAMGLAGHTADEFIETLYRFKDASSDYAGAQKIMLDTNPAIRFNKQVQELRNGWISFMMTIESASIKMVDALGGLSIAAKTVTGLTIGLIVRWSAWTSTVLHNTMTVSANTSALNANAAAQMRLKGTSLAMSPLKATLASAGIGLAVVALYELATAGQEAQRETSRLISEGFSKLEVSLSQGVTPTLHNVNDAFSEHLKKLAEYRATLTTVIDTQENVVLSKFDKMTDSIKKSEHASRSFITTLKDGIATLESAVDSSLDTMSKLSQEIDRNKLNSGLQSIEDPATRASLLESEIERRRVRGLELAGAGDPASIIEARRQLEEAVDLATKLKELRTSAGLEAAAEDKSAKQLSLETRRDRLLAERDRRQAASARFGRPDARIAEIDTLLSEINPSITSEEAKRKARGAVFSGLRNSDATLANLEAAQLKAEQMFQDAAIRQIDADTKKIALAQASLDELRSISSVMKNLDVATPDFAARVEKLVMDRSLSTMPDIKEDASELLDAAKALKSLRDESDKNLEASRTIEKQKKAAEDIANKAPEKALEKSKAIAAVAEIFDSEMPNLGRHHLSYMPGSAMQRLYKLQKMLVAKREEAEKAQRRGQPELVPGIMSLNQEDADFLRQFGSKSFREKFMQTIAKENSDYASMGGDAWPFRLTEDELDLLSKAGRTLGPPPAEPGNNEVIRPYESGASRVLDKLYARMKGSTDPFTQEDVDSIAALYGNGTKPPAIVATVEALNSLTLAAPEADKSLQALIDTLLKLNNAARNEGIDLHRKGKKSKEQSDADMLDLGDTRLFGGYSGSGGRHHPGEFVINKDKTSKYRSLLEMINFGRDETYMIGQSGGRTGGWNPYTLLDQWVFAYMNGRPLIRGLSARDNGAIAWGGSDPFGITPEMTPNYLNALQGITSKVQDYSLRMGGDPTSLVNSLWGRTGDMSTPWMKYQYGGRNGSTLNFGDFSFTFQGLHTNRESARDLANQVMSEVRRQLARGQGVI